MIPVRIQSLLLASLVLVFTQFHSLAQTPATQKADLKGKKIGGRMPASFGYSAVLLDEPGANFKKEEKFRLLEVKQSGEAYKSLNPLMTDGNTLLIPALGK